MSLSVLAGGETSSFPFELVLFAGTLLLIAVFHARALAIALSGLVVITLYKIALTDADVGLTLEHEAGTLLNLLGLLLGFATVARHFEESHLARHLERVLPRGMAGGLSLLGMVAILSTFLDNIAAAIIGASMASVVYQRRVHIGFLAAIVGSANAGGAGSVIGDTTTTMMWIAGVSPLELSRAFIGAAAAVIVMAVCAAWQQERYAPRAPAAGAPPPPRVDVGQLVVLALALGGTIAGNVLFGAPAVGLWLGLGLGSLIRMAEVNEIGSAFKGALFLLSLVAAASLMPVDELPAASTFSTFAVGVVSAVFDNIPLTRLALLQGGYDWGLLAYCVGFGGSMLWFGSSTGVAVSSIFPEARSVGAWLKGGWHVPVAYVVGFLVMLALT